MDSIPWRRIGWNLRSPGNWTKVPVIITVEPSPILSRLNESRVAKLSKLTTKMSSFGLLGALNGMTAKSTESSLGKNQLGLPLPSPASESVTAPPFSVFMRTLVDTTSCGWLASSQHSATCRLVTRYSNNRCSSAGGTAMPTRKPVPVKDCGCGRPFTLQNSSICTDTFRSASPGTGEEGSGAV